MMLMLAFLLSFSAWADQVGPCHDCTENQFFNFGQSLGWEAATRTQVRNAPCTRENPFTETEMTNWLNSNTGAQSSSEKIAGIEFEDESEENLKAFKRLVTAVNFFGDKYPDQESFTSNCKKVHCAVKQVFGDTGTQLLYMMRKYGFNGSHIAHRDDADAWKKTELDEIILALSDFPASVLPMRDNKKLIHFKRGYMRNGGENTVANAVIEVFDVWNEENKEMRRYTITHEVGHYLASESDVDESDLWKSFSGWRSQTSIINGEEVTQTEASNSGALVSRYGRSNPTEDFAESVSAYRYNPELLKDKSPEKYDLIKNVIFNGVEYTSAQACSSPTLVTDDIVEEARRSFEQWRPSAEDYDVAAKKCFPVAVKAFARSSELSLESSELANCYGKSIEESSRKFLETAIEDHPYADYMEPLLRRNNGLNLSQEKHAQYLSRIKSKFKDTFPRWIAHGVTSDSMLTPSCDSDDTTYVYQDFEEIEGFDNFTLRRDLSKIAQNLCKNAVANRNTLNSLNILSVRPPEIKAAVDRLIK